MTRHPYLRLAILLVFAVFTVSQSSLTDVNATEITKEQLKRIVTAQLKEYGISLAPDARRELNKMIDDGFKKISSPEDLEKAKKNLHEKLDSIHPRNPDAKLDAEGLKKLLCPLWPFC